MVDLEQQIARAQSGARGFEMMRLDSLPERYVEPAKKVQTLEEIWYGAIVNDVRRKHIEGQIDAVPACARCSASSSVAISSTRPTKREKPRERATSSRVRKAPTPSSS